MIVLLIFCMVIMSTSLANAIIDDSVYVVMGDSGWAAIVSPLILEAGDLSIWWDYDSSGHTLEVEPHKIFEVPPSQGDTFLPMVFEFQKISENATSTIIIPDEYIVNDTGVEWYDYHMQLMVSTVAPEAGFDPQYIFDGHQLEDVSYSEYMGYDGLPIRLDFYNAEGGGVPSEPPGLDVFQPGFLDGQLVIVIDPEMEVGERFGFKQLPSVPEPATMALLGMGALLAINRKRKYQ
jgi:hypothetical protein